LLDRLIRRRQTQSRLGLQSTLRHTGGAAGRGALDDVPGAVRGRLPREEEVRDRQLLEQLVDDTRDDLRDRGCDCAAPAAGTLEAGALHLERHGTSAEARTEPATVAAELVDHRLVAGGIDERLT